MTRAALSTSHHGKWRLRQLGGFNLRNSRHLGQPSLSTIVSVETIASTGTLNNLTTRYEITACAVGFTDGARPGGRESIIHEFLQRIP
jgi:hypothetical protein